MGIVEMVPHPNLGHEEPGGLAVLFVSTIFAGKGYVHSSSMDSLYDTSMNSVYWGGRHFINLLDIYGTQS